MADSDNESGGNRDHNSQSEMSPREQDRFLPIANVSRIMKKALPANAKISKDAKETVQECVSEFISFITGEASDKCQREKRKTINGDDLLWAMTTLGFEDYVEPLKVYLQRFRDMEGEKSAMAGRGEKEDGSSGGGNGGVGVNMGSGGGGGGGGYEGIYGMSATAMGGPVYGYGQMGGPGKSGSGYHMGSGSGGRPR
ncbi:nuclear transcription factor Y subunit B-3-like [Andrographis paniculata]|uniref:nuclear transcription factor Y subunit B-3-like n=1 Tax=Andrographis paniculata TaxID=175694 RepID=UPI0021E7200C|nr:nuclear transcription factor Y subunit B-3-like [Andrographis paniculata]